MVQDDYYCGKRFLGELDVVGAVYHHPPPPPPPPKDKEKIKKKDKKRKSGFQFVLSKDNEKKRVVGNVYIYILI